MMKKLLLFLVFVLLILPGLAQAQFLHNATGTTPSLSCTNLASGTFNYSTDVYLQVVTGNTTATLPPASMGCQNRDHVELYITQATNQSFTYTVNAGVGTTAVYPALNSTVPVLPPSSGGATNVTLHEIWIYNGNASPPNWELVTTETNPPTGSGVVVACRFAGATADVQLNNAVTALPNGGTVDATCFGTTAPTIAATVTVGTSGTQPITLLVDRSTLYNCTITNTTPCFQVGSGSAIVAQGVGPEKGWTLASNANISAYITNTPGSTGFDLEGVFIQPTGANPGASKGMVWLNAPLQPVIVRGLSIGGTANNILELIDNEGNSAIGPVEEYDPNIDCNNAVGCTPLKIGPPTTSNIFSGMTFVGGLFNHAGAGHPSVDIESSNSFGNPTSITFVTPLIEGNSSVTQTDGFLLNGGNGITIINPQSSVGGTNFIHIESVNPAAAPANIQVIGSSNPGGWTHNLVNSINGYTDNQFNIPAYFYNPGTDKIIMDSAPVACWSGSAAEACP